MGKRTGTRGSRALLALLLALALCLAGLPAMAEADTDFSFDLASADTSAGEASGGEDMDLSAFDTEEDTSAASDGEDAALFAGDEGAADVSQGADASDVAADAGDAVAANGAALFAEEAAADPNADITGGNPDNVFPQDIVITAVGDCTLGGISGKNTGKKFAKVAKAKGPDYFLSNVRPIFEKDDLTIVNLEGPLTNAKQTRSGQYYCFKGPPSYVKILTGSSVELCNVANNHSLDYQEQGLKDTAKTLDAAGIGYCGFSKVFTTTIKGVRISALGFTKWDHSAAQIKKAVAKARKDCDILIVNIHWGWEMKFAPDKQQKELGHAAVNAGADLVIGTHTHVYGGIEKYKGKYIIYSLGNFCFGGNSNPPDKRAYMFQQTLRYSPSTGVTDAGINIVPVYVSSTTKTNDYHPKLMGKKAGLKLLKAIARVSKGMSGKNTIWMPENYLAWAGIRSKAKLEADYAKKVQPLAEAQAQAAPVTAEGFFDDGGDGDATGDALFQDADDDQAEDVSQAADVSQMADVSQGADVSQMADVSQGADVSQMADVSQGTDAFTEEDAFADDGAADDDAFADDGAFADQVNDAFAGDEQGFTDDEDAGDENFFQMEG